MLFHLHYDNVRDKTVILYTSVYTPVIPRYMNEDLVFVPVFRCIHLFLMSPAVLWVGSLPVKLSSL